MVSIIVFLHLCMYILCWCTCTYVHMHMTCCKGVDDNCKCTHSNILHEISCFVFISGYLYVCMYVVATLQCLHRVCEYQQRYPVLATSLCPYEYQHLWYSRMSMDLGKTFFFCAHYILQKYQLS